jgi:hypothetical protein
MMSRSFIEIIYIDSADHACQTNLVRSCETDAATWAEFQSYRRHAVNINQACFLLDYHNRKGGLGSTIPIDAEGFKAITGQAPKSEAEYRQIDTEFWNDVSKAAA